MHYIYRRAGWWGPHMHFGLWRGPFLLGIATRALLVRAGSTIIAGEANELGPDPVGVSLCAKLVLLPACTCAATVLSP